MIDPRTAPLVGLLALAACAGPGDTLRPAATLPLPDSSFQSLAIDARGTFWVARPGGLLHIDAEGEGEERLESEGDAAPAPMGSRADRVYFRTPRTLLAVDSMGRTLEMPAPRIDAAALDPAGRFLLTTLDAGEVVAYDPSSLRAIWGWADVGAASDALVVAPESDLVYQPVPSFEFRPDPEILVRDLQTGRIRHRLRMAGEVRALVVGPDGSLYGTITDRETENGGRIFALEWRAGRIRLRWQRALDDLGIGPRVRLATDRSGGTLAVLAPNEEAGLHLLRGETGHVVARLSGPIRDVAFDPAGGLWILRPGRIVRVE